MLTCVTRAINDSSRRNVIQRTGIVPLCIQSSSHSGRSPYPLATFRQLKIVMFVTPTLRPYPGYDTHRLFDVLAIEAKRLGRAKLQAASRSFYKKELDKRYKDENPTS